jgi:response regulator RpfG family c-di-GMP phosphodiesterase
MAVNIALLARADHDSVESQTLSDLYRLLINEGYSIARLSQMGDAVEFLKKGSIAMLLSTVSIDDSETFGLIKSLKKDSHFKNLPILILSATPHSSHNEIIRVAAQLWGVKHFNLVDCDLKQFVTEIGVILKIQCGNNFDTLHRNAKGLSNDAND